MKSLWTCLVITVLLQPGKPEKSEQHPIRNDLPVNRNLFIITTDGFRWQELFNGADSVLINNDDYTPDKETIKTLYWADSPCERRKKLMPFFWNVLAQKGQLFGNRKSGNKVDVANDYAISYPGYNEIFTGTTDETISSNARKNNPNINVLEYINDQPSFKNKVAVFTSWDVFPFIFNAGRNELFINSGYQPMPGQDAAIQMINRVQTESVPEKKHTRYDELTFMNAMEYLRQQQPRVLFLALGETDEFAHEGRYDLYLQQANKVDAMIAQLWHFVQTTPGYKDNTSIIITTDHGRGSKSRKWTSHGALIKGSSETWMAVMGPGIQSLGELKGKQQLYQQQIAATIAKLLGEEFPADGAIARLSVK